MFQNALPKAAVEILHCKCKKKFKTNACSCRKAGLECNNAYAFCFSFSKCTIQIIIFYCIHGGIKEKKK